MDRSELTVNDLRKNDIFLGLKKYYTDNSVDINKAPPELICIETKEVFTIPVVTKAKDEKGVIQDITKEHEAKEGLKSYPYTNRLAKDIIEKCELKSLPSQVQVPVESMEPVVAQQALSKSSMGLFNAPKEIKSPIQVAPQSRPEDDALPEFPAVPTHEVGEVENIRRRPGLRIALSE